MFRVTILKTYEEDKRVRIEYIDGDECHIEDVKSIDVNEIFTWLFDTSYNKDIEVNFEDEISFRQISIDCYEGEGEYDVLLNTYEYNKDGEKGYKCETLMTCSTLGDAIKFARGRYNLYSNCYEGYIIESN